MFRITRIHLFIYHEISIPCAFRSLEGRETKKRLTLARLLKGLKTVNRRDRTNPQAAGSTATTTVQFRVSDCFDQLRIMCN